MKKFIALLTIGTLLAGTSQGQDARATAILDAMSQKYKAYGSFSAQFTYQAAGEKPQKGEFTAKGTKYRMKLAGQEIYNDGKTVATYLRDNNEVNLSDAEPGDSELNPAQIYTLHKKGYTPRFVQETKEGGQAVEIVELTPQKKNAPVRSVRLTVNKADKTVRGWRITDSSGQVQTFRVEKFTPNVAVTDQAFAFDKTKYPGVEVVDLR